MDKKMNVSKGGAYRVEKTTKGMGGVKFFAPGYLVKLFSLNEG